MASDLDAKRIQHLYELLGTYHEELASVEQDLARAPAGRDRARLRLQIKDVWDEIRGNETELAELLSRHADAEKIPANEADEVLAELTMHIVRLKGAEKPNWPADVLAKLDDLEAKLDEPGKAAAAKLKLSLPIVPLLASYDFELDTESTLVQVWRKITGLFRKSTPDPT